MQEQLNRIEQKIDKLLNLVEQKNLSKGTDIDEFVNYFRQQLLGETKSSPIKERYDLLVKQNEILSETFGEKGEMLLKELEVFLLKEKLSNEEIKVLLNYFLLINNKVPYKQVEDVQEKKVHGILNDAFSSLRVSRVDSEGNEVEELAVITDEVETVSREIVVILSPTQKYPFG